ncbi:MAG: secretin N-terminal domain-containing protein [Candidatus Omnitrophica bacterium]|nr:secretin N-terminal domain-containing protein [Candidatus Omnitrophota bacterium]
MNLFNKKTTVLIFILLLGLISLKNAFTQDNAQQAQSGSTQQPSNPTANTPLPNNSPIPQTSEQQKDTRDPTDNPSTNPALLPISSSSTTKVASEEEITKGVKVDGEERLSLDLKGIDINELFRILSLKMGVTIVPTKSVAGRVNIFLNNLSFEDALDVVLVSQDLAADRNNEIINIMTSSEYERLYGKKYNEKRKYRSLKLNFAKPATIFNALGQIKSDIGKIIVDEATGTIIMLDIPEKLDQMEKTVKDLDRSPQTEIFDIKYAKPADIKTQIASAITTGPGEVFVDERSGKLIISDLPDKMKKLKRMVKAIDEESRQVFIEAEIVQITLKDEYQRGISWEKLIQDKNIHGIDLKGTLPASPSFTPSPLLTAANYTFTFGTLAADRFTTTLQFLNTIGATKILSRPRIAAINNQEAKIMVGSREAYISQSQSQSDVTTITSENVQFIDVGVKLSVVPTINKDGYITMKIKPEVSSVRETITTALKSTIPIVETSEAETVVKVKDGTMIMIAGLMKNESRRDRVGLPWFSKIPLIGAAFGSDAQQKKRTELIVFLTPHLISGENLFQGTEPERMIPYDIVAEDTKEDIIERKVGEIKMSPKKEEAVLEALQTPKTSGSSIKPDTKQTEVQEKLKGIKEF